MKRWYEGFKWYEFPVFIIIVILAFLITCVMWPYERIKYIIGEIKK